MKAILREWSNMRIHGLAGISRRIVQVGAVLALAATGCDLEVTNPGPVQDEFLNDERAFPSVLQGVRRASALAYTRLAYDSGMMSFEGTPGGLFDAEFVNGKLTSDNVDDHWDRSQQARWMAEDGVRRLKEALGGDFSSNEIGGNLLVLAGYANRTLGHNMCIAVFDAGPEQPYTDYPDPGRGTLHRGDRGGERRRSLRHRAGRPGRPGRRAHVARGLGRRPQRRQRDPGELRLPAAPLRSGRFPGSQRGLLQVGLRAVREYTIWGTFAEGYYPETGDPRMGGARIRTPPSPWSTTCRSTRS